MWWWLVVVNTVLVVWLIHLLFSRRWRGPWYWLRWVRLVVEVWLERLTWNKRLDNYDLSSTLPSYEYCGIEATPSEKELELPKPLITDRHEDEVCVCGVERGGRVVVARVARLTKRRASILLYLRDRQGDVYTLPNQPDTSQVNVDPDGGWRGAGLALMPVEAMRCWRIKYNGLMRRGWREQYVTEKGGKPTSSDEGDSEDDIVEVRLDLLWRGMAAPVELWEGTSLRLLAHTLAQRPFTSLPALRNEQGDGYEQWGSLHGAVTLGTEAAPVIWHLRGPRRHRWGLTPSGGGGLHTYAYFNNGDCLCLRGHFSTHDSTLSTRAGYLQRAAGDLLPVSWTDLDPCQHPSHPTLASRPHHLLLKFTAGGQLYETWHQLGERMPFYTGDPWVISHDLHPTTVASSHSYGWGVTLFSRGYTDLCPVPERESLPALPVPRVDLQDDGAPLVVPLDDPRCRGVELVGGKGASLAFLMAYKELIEPDQEEYEVPLGVVVTAAAWQRQLQAHPDLLQAVRAVGQAAILSQPSSLKDACARAVEVCSSTRVCEEVANALLEEAEDLWEDLSTYSLAVRSSGCSEDGEEASAAGQNETLLGVRGRERLLAALASCWASIFSFHSVEYRRQRGQGVECGVGVVVQEMVNAEAAGVVFTADPTTGSPATFTITVNYGLGESVVSGSSEPDTVVVRRGWRGNLKLLSTSRGAKTTKCVLKGDGGTEEVEVVELARQGEVLDERAVLRLARVADYVQQAFGGPRDIEFAMEQGRVHLLQSRAITTLETWSDWELTHEQDTALLTDHELLTRANTGEVLPGSSTPLSLSVTPSVLDRSFQRDQQRIFWPLKTSHSPHHVRLCPCYATQVFLNMLEMQYSFILEGSEVTVPFHAIDLAVYGHPVTKGQYLEWGLERHGKPSLVTKILYFLSILRDTIVNTSRYKRCQHKYSDYSIGSHRADTAASLHAEISRRIPEYMEVGQTHHYTSRFSSLTQSIAFTMLAEGKKQLSEANTSDMATLLSSCTGVESADVPTALKELARVLSENEEVDEFLGMTAEEAAVWLQSHPGHLGHAFRAFLHRHGHRCVRELDLGAVSWRMEPQSLVHTLQVMARLPDVTTQQQQQQQQKETVKEDTSLEQVFSTLRSPLSKRTRRALGFLLPMCRRAVVQREGTKSLLTKTIDGLREGYRNLGQLMVQEGRLPSADLVFFLKHSELGQLVTSPSPAFIAKARRRQRLYPNLNDLKFPEVNIGLPIKVSDDSDDGGVEDGTGGGGGGGQRKSQVQLVGTPVCHGKVTARARVVTKLQEAVSIERGDVLVTTSTDVGWTPYFPLLSGVVTEIGGLISHGAVVAREYGLPCLVGVSSATHHIKSGDMVLLDASKGTLTVHHHQEYESQQQLQR